MHFERKKNLPQLILVENYWSTQSDAKGNRNSRTDGRQGWIWGPAGLGRRRAPGNLQFLAWETGG